MFQEHQDAIWDQIWQPSDVPHFHLTKVNALLSRNIERFENGREGLKVLVPLCGKSMDLLWLAKRGHSVVGVEGAAKAVKLFFTENCLPYKCREIGPFQVFECQTEGITIYCGDFFEAKPEFVGGKFDLIWDRGAFNTTEVENRPAYKRLLADLGKTGTTFLLALIEMSDVDFLDNEAVHKEMRDEYDVEAIDFVDLSTRANGVDYGFTEDFYSPDVPEVGFGERLYKLVQK